MTEVVEAARQGFVGDVTWAGTWPGIVALGGPARRARRPRAARNAPHRPVTRRRDDPIVWGHFSPVGGRDRGAGAARELGRGRARRGALRLHAAEPEPLSVAVVLGLLLRGDRLAALRAGARANRAGEPARRPAPGRLHRPHDLLGAAGLADPAALLQRRLAPLLPDRDDPAAAARLGLADRRRRPGARSRGSPPRPTGWRPTATSRATACSGSSSPTSRGSTPRRSSTRSGAGGRTRGSASRCSSTATAGSASTPAGSATRRAGPLRGPGQHALVALAAGAGPPLGDAGAGRAALGRGPRALPRRGAAGRRPTRRPSPGPRWPRSRCPTCPRRSAAAWSRSTCSTRTSS